MGRLRASNAPRWVPCPGSVALEERQPERAPDEGAAEGTAAHEAAHRVLMGETPDGLINQRASNGVVITDVMIDHVMTYVEALQKSRASRRVETYLEQKISCYVVHEENDGTSDCVDWFPDEKHLTVSDFKYGWGIVEPFSNWQLIDYAAGWCAHLGWEPKTITLRVVQPRPVHIEGAVREWHLTTLELSEYIKVMQRSAVDAVNSLNPEYRPGPHQCKDCTGRHECGALHAAAMDALDEATRSVPFELNGDGLGFELKKLRRATKLLDARLTGLEADAESRLTVGKPVAGFYLRPNKGHRKWSAPIEEVKALGALYGVKLTKEELITPSAAVRAKMPKTVVEGSAITERPFTGYKLVEGGPEKRAKELFKND